MACATQTVVSQGIPNPLTAEDLLKIPRDLTHLIPLQNLLPIPVPASRSSFYTFSSCSLIHQIMVDVV